MLDCFPPLFRPPLGCLRQAAGALLLSALLAPVVEAQRGANPPVRLALTVKQQTIRAGEVAEITVAIRDAYNRDREAPKEYNVRLEIQLGRETTEQSVLIRAGTSSSLARVPMRTPGIYLIKAMHRELREDAIHLRVRPEGSSRGEPWWIWPQPRLLRASWTGAPVSWQPRPSTQPLELILLCSCDGAKLSANGSDKARIQAFLNREAPVDIRLRFYDDEARLQPNPLVIPRGQEQAEAYLTSDVPRAVRVRYISSVPPNIFGSVEGGDRRVVFAPTVKEIQLTPSPPRIPLGDASELQVSLLGLNGQIVETDEAMEVHFTIESGLGDFKPETVVIASGDHFGKTEFKPRSTGVMMISAAAFGARTREAQAVEVITPKAVLAWTLIGGLIGGLLAGLRRRPLNLTEAGISAATGPAVAIILCLACQYGLIPNVPAEIVSNWLGVFALSLLAGWGGAELLDAMLRLFGKFSTPPPAQPRQATAGR